MIHLQKTLIWSCVFFLACSISSRKVKKIKIYSKEKKPTILLNFFKQILLFLDLNTSAASLEINKSASSGLAILYTLNKGEQNKLHKLQQKSVCCT